ncbi:hypothetical protein JM658_11970 [Joostella atrarenae]|uniref:Uncharacterized protein n=1 Tax=Joostella atrarenae TaxID=679257 RepID=A0ABS9J551_9FLAO|nr:hypothetical protein [Joostella atrarenae]MCF8715542.1 hypothetical protein [Joostella atrarenae]
MESIIAMSVVAICLSCAFLIFGNVLESATPDKLLVGEQKVKELYRKLAGDEIIEDQSYEYEGYTIEQQVNQKKERGYIEVLYIIQAGKMSRTYKYLMDE